MLTYMIRGHILTCRYHALILAFFALAGVPLVMNTSFNLNRMPIVESPADAIGCFLEASEDLSLLVLSGARATQKHLREHAKGHVQESGRVHVACAAVARAITCAFARAWPS